MVEYSSVSASSYDPASLVAKLNASSEEGWEVVSIVPTGGDVTAFLQRSGADAETDEAVVETEAEVVELVTEEPSGEFVLTEVAVAEVAVAEVVDATPTGAPSPVEEPAGWAVAPAVEAPAEPDLAPSPEPPVPTAPDVTAAPEPTAEPAVAEPAPEPITEPAPEPAPAEAAAPAESSAPAVAPVVTTPAGWYPDPSSRFELRYWDGTQWTEHVARGGQQYTDPPVA
jgi:hypothetical protein